VEYEAGLAIQTPRERTPQSEPATDIHAVYCRSAPRVASPAWGSRSRRQPVGASGDGTHTFHLGTTLY
jgi:hypothetical protein